MQEFVSYALLGLGAGAVYVLLGLGLVVIHRSSGVLNFAIGAQAMIGAYIWQELRDAGVSEALAVLMAGAASALIGVVAYLVVMRPLSHRAPLVSITASLSLLLVLQTAALLHYGTDSRLIFGFLPSEPVEVLGTTLGEDRLWLAGIAILVTIVLGVSYRYLLVGRATEAVAADQRLAASLGWSPSLVAAFNWAGGSALAGTAGVLITPLTGLQVSRLTLLVLPALAVAMIAGFRSFTVVAIAGLGLGIAESEINNYISIQGASQALPLLVIIVVLALGGAGIPQRDFRHDRLPAVGTGQINLPLVGVVTVVLLGAILSLPVEWIDATIQSGTAALLLISVVVVTGYAGQLSLAQYAIAGVGAFAAGRLVAAQGWPFELAALAGIAAATVVGVLFGLPALRARGATLAVMTLGLGQALYAVVFSNSKYTGNINGTVVGPQTFFGIDIDPVVFPRRYAILCVLGISLTLFVASRLRRGRAGRRLLSVRENERAAAALGVNVVAAKLYGFAVASAFAGLAGVLIAFSGYSVRYSAFDPFSSITLVTFAVLAGVGYAAGQPLVALLAAGGGVGTVIFDKVSLDPNWIVLVSGVLTILTLIALPDGIVAGKPGKKRSRPSPVAGKRAKGKDDTEAPAPTAQAPTPVGLKLSGITVRFGGVTALEDVHLEAEPGKVTGLIGPNGAGKTTLIDVASGFVQPAAGSVRLGEREVTKQSRYLRARAGLSRSFQSLELFEDLTVRENLLAAADSRDAFAYVENLVFAGDLELPPMAARTVEVFGLESVLESYPGELPYGQRRLVAIARSVACSPSVLLLDEPAAGLGREQTDELGELIRLLAGELGLTVVLVEHDLQFVLEISDKLIVLDQGKLLASGDPQEVIALPAVRAAYLGEEESTHVH